MRTATTFLLLALLASTSSNTLAARFFYADSSQQSLADDTKLLEGLRRRRLFGLAESFCKQELAKTDRDPTTQATLVIELIKTQTARAIVTPSEQRAAVWDAATDAANSFLQKYPNHPRRFLVQVQLALSHIIHSTILRQELAADLGAGQAREQALAQIKIARTMLDEIQNEISKTIPKQNGRSLTEHELTAAQLLSLNKNIRYQQLICNLNRAHLTLASDRLNRIDSLNNVQARLQEVLRETAEETPLWWKAKLAQIECLRLLRNLDQAKALANQLPLDSISDTDRQLLLEQEAQLAIGLGDEAYMNSLLSKIEALDSTSAQLDLAVIEAAATMSARASSDQRRNQWLAFATKSAQEIEQIHGAYWRRRADLVLISTVKGKSAGGAPSARDVGNANTDNTNSTIKNAELNLLIRLAEDAVRKNQFQDALKAYDKSVALAQEIGNLAQALTLDIQASQVFEKQNRHAEAASRLIAAAKRSPRQTIASSAHLRGCWNLAKTLTSSASQRNVEFESHLVEHLRIWSDRDSANQVRIWRGSQLKSKQEWEKAFSTYIAVDPASPHFSAGIAGATESATAAMMALRRSGRSTRSAAAQWIKRLGRLATESSSLAAVEIEVAIAELDLIFGSSQPDKNWSAKTKNFVAEIPPNLTAKVRAIMVVSSCGDDPEQASVALAEITDDVVALDLCERCLSSVIDFSGGSSEPIANAKKLRLAAIEQALKNVDQQRYPTAIAKENWLLRQSRALTALGRHGEAVVTLQGLEAQFPRNAGIQMKIARALTAQFEDSNPEKPLTKWRQTAARLKSHTANWYEAKYQVARLLSQTGKKTEAKTLLKYIKTVPPGWDQSVLKPKFEQLLKSVSR